MQVNAGLCGREDAFRAVETGRLRKLHRMWSTITRASVLSLAAAAVRVAVLIGLTLAALLLTSIDKSYACSDHHGGVMHISSTSIGHTSTHPSASPSVGVVVKAATSDTDPCIAGTCSHRAGAGSCACCATYSIAVSSKGVAEFAPAPGSVAAMLSQRDVASLATSPEVPPPILSA
jgi:hypothetical protein